MLGIQGILTSSPISNSPPVASRIGVWYAGYVKEKRKQDRTITLVRSPSTDGVGIFRIGEGGKSTFYTFHEIPCEIGGRGFAIHRLGLGNLYHVRVGGPEDCSCECMGFLRWNHCKHIAGLKALIARGLL